MLERFETSDLLAELVRRSKLPRNHNRGKVVEMFVSGISRKRISEELKCSLVYVNRVLKENGLWVSTGKSGRPKKEEE